MCPPSARPIAKRGPGRYCHNCNTRNNARSLRCYHCNSLVRKKRGRPRKYQAHPYRVNPTSRLTFYPLATKTSQQSSSSVNGCSVLTMSDPTPPSSNPLSPAQQQEAPSSLPTSSQSLSPPSSSAQTAQPLNDFMGMLKMRRSSEDSNGSKGVKKGEVVKKSSGEKVKERNGEGEVEDMETESGSGKVQETLVDKFKKDPNSVLQLLESALTMDKIGSLLSKHHRQDKKKVEELRSKLEAAYHTLKECAQQKGVLNEKIQVTNDKIKAKRKQLESLREELRVLGEEELQLKRKRDASYTNCADLKKKLKCSRDALQQLAVLAPAKNNGSSKGGIVGEGSQHA